MDLLLHINKNYTARTNTHKHIYCILYSMHVYVFIHTVRRVVLIGLALILLMWRIWWASKDASKWHAFQKSVKEIRGSLKSDKNNGTLYEAFCICTFVILSRWILLRMRNLQTKVAEKIKIHLLNSTLFPENRVVHDVMWKNMVQPDRPQMTITYSACASSAGYLKPQTHTHTYSFSTATMVTRTRLNITLYVQCLSCCHSVTQTGSPFRLRTKLSKLLLNNTKSSETNMSASVWVSIGLINCIALALMSGCERN